MISTKIVFGALGAVSALALLWPGLKALPDARSHRIGGYEGQEILHVGSRHYKLSLVNNRVSCSAAQPQPKAHGRGRWS